MTIVGKQLGPYQVISSLGSGGMGEVYRAKDSRLDRDVAIKVLPQQFASDPDRRARFERECKAVAALSHPNILAIHDYAAEGEVAYAVTELLEGENLRQRLLSGPQSWRKTVEIGIALAEGLAAAHAKGIVHRDLKPENIFLTSDGRVKILDFGLARYDVKTTAETDTKPYQPARTDPGAVMGTAGYMSPEQVRGKVVDHRTDIFSLGCVLYELVANQRAFQRETTPETMTAILHDEPPELSTSGRRIPLEVDRVIRHCLEKEASARFHSAHDLAFALKAILSDSGPLTPLTSSKQRARSRRSLFLAAGALFVVATLALTIAVWSGWFGGGKTGGPAPGGKTINSLAVLPFENLSGDPYTGFLSDSLSEFLVDSLSRFPQRQLTVRPSAATSRFKGESADIPTVGRELLVEAVVTGKINQFNEDLTISIALIDAKQFSHLWGKQYQGKREDLQTLKESIVADLSTAMEPMLLPKE